MSGQRWQGNQVIATCHNIQLFTCILLITASIYVLSLSLQLVSYTNSTDIVSLQVSPIEIMHNSLTAAGPENKGTALPQVCPFVPKITSITAGIKHYRIHYNNADMSFGTALELLRDGNSCFIDTLASSLSAFDTKSFFFECAPITTRTLYQAKFEFVLVPAPQMDEITADMTDFRAHILAAIDNARTHANPATRETNNLVTSFWNLGKDSLLVVPCPNDSEIVPGGRDSFQMYAHLAPFVRSKATEHIRALWSSVGQLALQMLLSPSRPADDKLWISTSGLGVSWLHVRLDKRPKYYNYNPYKL